LCVIRAQDFCPDRGTNIEGLKRDNLRDMSYIEHRFLLAVAVFHTEWYCGHKIGTEGDDIDTVLKQPCFKWFETNMCQGSKREAFIV
jgi:hypothetical protein